MLFGQLWSTRQMKQRSKPISKKRGKIRWNTLRGVVLLQFGKEPGAVQEGEDLPLPVHRNLTRRVQASTQQNIFGDVSRPDRHGSRDMLACGWQADTGARRTRRESRHTKRDQRTKTRKGHADLRTNESLPHPPVASLTPPAHPHGIKASTIGSGSQDTPQDLRGCHLLRFRRPPISLPQILLHLPQARIQGRRIHLPIRARPGTG